jgi:hypothetical protein
MDDQAFQRFQAKYTVLANGCWQWLGAKIGRGYGVMASKSGSRLVHRLSYEHFIGPIPDALTIDHLCRNKACVNPMHLEAVTNKVNNLRGTSASAQNTRKTHCSMGHEYTYENTYIHHSMRHCKTCHRLRERQRKAQLKQRSQQIG